MWIALPVVGHIVHVWSCFRIACIFPVVLGFNHQEDMTLVSLGALEAPPLGMVPPRYQPPKAGSGVVAEALHAHINL